MSNKNITKLNLSGSIQFEEPVSPLSYIGPKLNYRGRLMFNLEPYDPCLITSDDFKVFTDSLKNDKTIKVLDLGYNFIKGDYLKNLCNSLKSNSSLEILGLLWNNYSKLV